MVLDMDTVMVLDTMAMDWDTMARGLLMLMPSLLLILTTMVDTMVLDMDTVMVLDTMAMDWDTMARGPLMLMPSLLLILTTMVDTMVLDMDMVMVLDTTAMDWDTMARGLLMLSPRLMLIPTCSMVDMVDMVWATMVAMDMAADTTGDKSSHQQGDLDIHQDLSVNRQLLCQQKMDYFSLSFIPHQCCQFQCCQPSHARNGEQEAIENQNVLIRQIKSKTKKK